MLGRVSTAHAERPHFLADLEGVDQGLRLALPDREHVGEIGKNAGDSARLASLVDAPVVLGVRVPESFSARLLARSDTDEADIYAAVDLAMREDGDQRAVVMRCIASGLTLSLISILDPAMHVERASDVPPPVLHWSLRATSADATARADVLDFLRVLHQGGKLQIIDAEVGESVAALDAPGAPFDAGLARDSAFLTDVATLEEWAGMVLPVPNEVPAAEVAKIAQAATMVRSREIPVAFSGDIAATMPADILGIDEIELAQDFGVTVFGFDVPLGVGHVRLPVVAGETTPVPGQPDLVRVALRPVAASSVLFTLTPPDEREPYKRTLVPGETPAGPAPGWPKDWMTGEHDVSRDLRAGRGVRFVSESAFLEWLAHPDATAPILTWRPMRCLRDSPTSFGPCRNPQQEVARAAARDLATDLNQRVAPRRSLRVKRVRAAPPGVLEMTWAHDGRATFVRTGDPVG